MTRHIRARGRHKREAGEHSDMIAICLSDGPRTVAEIEQQFIAFPRRFGLFIELIDQASIERGDLTRDLLVSLEQMTEAGWVDRQDDLYALTELGRAEAAERLAGLDKAGKLARRFLQPQTVSQVSLGLHLGLAALKLPAGLLSGSVGLINDAADTLLDGVASLLVYAGFRLDRERAVNVVLVVLMLGTGGLTSYEAVHRFLTPFAPKVDWFAFLAAGLSALVCLGLWAYQRYVGLRSGSMALITQSVDSRNHVIVALGVTAGLVAALLRVSLLDTVVGLLVAILILKSAVELGVETIRSWEEGEVDLSRYRVGLTERYDRFRRAQLRDWMLTLVEHGDMQTEAELRVRASEALDFSDNAALRGFGLDRQSEAAELIEASLDALREQGWLAGDGQLTITAAGRRHMRQLSRRGRGKRRNRVLSRWCSTVPTSRLDYPAGASRVEQISSIMRQHLVHSGLKPVHSFVLYGENASEGITIHEGIGIVGRDDTPIDEAYQYNVASITKPVVATIILQLVEEGRLQLDDPVREYLAHVDHLQFKKLHVLDGESHAGEITIDHLLQHRSGLGDIFIDTAARFNLSVLLHPQRQYSPEMIMERFFSYGLNRAPHFKPGEGYYYSDINYVLLGLIIEQVTGDSLSHQIRRRVLRPLEMDDTYFEFYEPEVGRGKRLDTYLGPINVTRRINTSYEWAGGGLVSTTEDMATFIKGLFRLKLFEREATLHLMVDNSANEADGQTYARGIDHYLLGGETYYGHAGFYGSLLVYNPAEGIVLSAHLAQANPPYQVKGLIATVLETLEAPNADCVGEV